MKTNVVVISDERHSILTSKLINEAYQQGKADAIDECINLSKNMGKNTYFTNDWLRYFVNKLEQLKE